MQQGYRGRCRRLDDEQCGTVLLAVVLLIVMFTGLGLLAMRHTRLELRSTGAYLDATQAGELAEGALAVVSTDLRLSSDYYEFMFTNTDADAGVLGLDETYTIPLSSLIQDEHDGGTVSDGTIPFLNGNLASNAELGQMYGVSADTEVTHRAPALAPCPPGYSCDDEQNYAWYYFTIDSTARYGPPETPAHPLYESGRARGRGRVMVGPISAFGK
jgi:Tfp pilus assembly protein PilX